MKIKKVNCLLFKIPDKLGKSHCFSFFDSFSSNELQLSLMNCIDIERKQLLKCTSGIIAQSDVNKLVEFLAHTHSVT